MIRVTIRVANTTDVVQELQNHISSSFTAHNIQHSLSSTTVYSTSSGVQVSPLSLPPPPPPPPVIHFENLVPSPINNANNNTLDDWIIIVISVVSSVFLLGICFSMCWCYLYNTRARVYE